MAKVSVTTAWQSVTITADEVWRANGAIWLGTRTEPTTTADAMPLATGDSIGFQTGVKVYYRAPVATTAIRVETSA